MFPNFFGRREVDRPAVPSRWYSTSLRYTWRAEWGYLRTYVHGCGSWVGGGFQNGRGHPPYFCVFDGALPLRDDASATLTMVSVPSPHALHVTATAGRSSAPPSSVSDPLSSCSDSASSPTSPPTSPLSSPSPPASPSPPSSSASSLPSSSLHQLWCGRAGGVWRGRARREVVESVRKGGGRIRPAWVRVRPSCTDPRLTRRSSPPACCSTVSADASDKDEPSSSAAMVTTAANREEYSNSNRAWSFTGSARITIFHTCPCRHCTTTRAHGVQHPSGRRVHPRL